LETIVTDLINRREFLSTFVGGIAATSKPRLTCDKALSQGSPSATQTTTRLSIAEYAPYRSALAEIVQQRLDLYKALGCGALRLGVGWWDLETSEGHWRELPVLGYFDRANANGFRFRLEVGTVAAPPRGISMRIRTRKSGTSRMSSAKPILLRGIRAFIPYCRKKQTRSLPIWRV